MKSMMIVSPLRMQWEDNYKNIFPDAEWSETPKLGYDKYLFMWCDEQTQEFINNNPKQGKYTVFVRRYEYYMGLEKIDWSKVDAVIMVNDFLAEGFERRIGIKPHVIYNGVDPNKWTFKERSHGKNIAWVGFINQKKNLPLALQIMAALPKGYELHIAGETQDPQTWDYLHNFSIAEKIKVVYHGHIPHSFMNKWLDDKHYILSTAISEGCPNHVIEAMAKGIKPVVHSWPGAKEQFRDIVFNTIDEARAEIEYGYYQSKNYQGFVMNKFGLANYEKVKEIICGV